MGGKWCPVCILTTLSSYHILKAPSLPSKKWNAGLIFCKQALFAAIQVCAIRKLQILFKAFYFIIFRHVRKIAKSDYYLCHTCPSVCQHETARLPLDGFSLNLLFEYFFPNTFRENKVPLKSDKNNGYLYEVVCRLVIIHRLIFLEINVSEKICRQNQNTHSDNFFWPKIMLFMRCLTV